MDEYIHRVGRTARGENGQGKALIILLKSELGFIRCLKKFKVVVNEYDFPESKLAKISEQYLTLVEKNYYLNQAAKDAYKAYLHVCLSNSRTLLRK